MKEMELKNAELKRRYVEVQNDRMVAENKDSAITKELRKEKNSSSYEAPKTEKNTEYTREWDRGKSDKDNWKSPDHHGSFKSYRSGHYGKRDSDRQDKWGSYSRNDDDTWNDCKTTGHYGKRDGDRQDKWGSYSRNDDDSWNDYKSTGHYGKRDGDRRDKWGSYSRNNEDSWNDYKSTAHFDKKDSIKREKWSNYSRNEDSWNNYKSAGHHERNSNDRRDNRNNFSKNETGDQYRHDCVSDNRKPKGNYRYKHDNDRHNSSSFNRSPKRMKGDRNTESYKKSQYHSDEKCRKPDFNQLNSRKKYSRKNHSRSSSRSDSDQVDDNLTGVQFPKLNELTLWENCKFSEELVKKNKQDRVKTWIESVNKSKKYLEEHASSEKVKNDTKPYSKFYKCESPSNDADLNSSDYIPENNSLEETKYQTNRDSMSEKTNVTKSYSKVDRFEHPSNDEDSDANDNIPENKFQNETNYQKYRNSTSEMLNYHENECQNKKLSTYSVGYSSTRQNIDVRRRSAKTKHIEICDSRSSKNEHFVKHRKLDNEGSGDGIWNMSVNENKKTKYAGNNKFYKKNASYDNDNSWIKQTQAADHWGITEQSPTVNDGKWGSAEQSISWQISDEEDNINKKNVSKEYPAGDTWNDYFDNLKTDAQNENQSIVSGEQPAITIVHGDTYIKHDDNQQNISSKFADKTNHSDKDKMKCNFQDNKSKVEDGWEDHLSATDFPNILNEICENMDEKCKIDGEKFNESTLGLTESVKTYNLNKRADWLNCRYQCLDQVHDNEVRNIDEREYSEGEVVTSDEEEQV